MALRQGRRSSIDTAGPFDRPRQSSYTGLTWDKTTCMWRVRVNCRSKQHHVGRFKEDEEAAQAYDCAAFLLIGPAAAVNFGPQRAEKTMRQFMGRINLPALKKLKEVLTANGPISFRPVRSGKKGGAARDETATATGGVSEAADASVMYDGKGMPNDTSSAQALGTLWRSNSISSAAPGAQAAAAAADQAPCDWGAAPVFSCPLPAVQRSHADACAPVATAAYSASPYLPPGAASASLSGTPSAAAALPDMFCDVEDSSANPFFGSGQFLSALAAPRAGAKSAPLAGLRPLDACSGKLGRLTSMVGASDADEGAQVLLALLPDGDDSDTECSNTGDEAQWFCADGPAVERQASCRSVGGRFAFTTDVDELDAQLDMMLRQLEPVPPAAAAGQLQSSFSSATTTLTSAALGAGTAAGAVGSLASATTALAAALAGAGGSGSDLGLCGGAAAAGGGGGCASASASGGASDAAAAPQGGPPPVEQAARQQHLPLQDVNNPIAAEASLYYSWVSEGASARDSLF